jgi:tetratricopeptide (TPR) repeat protein
MPRFLKSVPAFLVAFSPCVASTQVASKTAPTNPTVTAERAVKLAESGHCQEALPLLTKSVQQVSDKDLQKRVGLDGVRCASTLQKGEQLLDFLRVLNREFPHDPEVLYLTVHGYSDLSTLAARELAQAAPDSIPALELDAEANEMQGKWDEAEKDYRQILQKNPRYPGIHFRLARIQLSKPNPAPDFKDVARKELQREVEIDPSNPEAEYILGELARQSDDMSEAVDRFTKAIQIDQNFADAYLALGTSLLKEKKYVDAIAPLEMAVKLQPANPLGHYNLATAYARTGRKEDAEREFALHKQTSERATGPGTPPPQSQPPQ